MFGSNAKLSIAIKSPNETTVIRSGKELVLPLLSGNDDIIGKV